MLKAHAANHKRQAASMFCRERGFAHEDELERRAAPAAPIVVEDVRELEAEEPEIPEGAEEAKVPVEVAVSQANANQQFFRLVQSLMSLLEKSKKRI